MSSPSIPIALWHELEDNVPAAAQVDGVDLVVVRRGEDVAVFQGRCPHRGALLADGRVEGGNLVCGVHGYDFRLDTGVSDYNPAERIHRFAARREGTHVVIDKAELVAYQDANPSPAAESTYDRLYNDPHQNTPAEPYVTDIHHMARHGLSSAHGDVAAMGVPRTDLPSWDDLQILTAQLHRLPLLDEAPVDTTVTIGPAAARPLRLDIPLFVSDMSFGALSAEAKTALALGAEGAGTAICSGEGGMLPEEQAANSRYLYELASGRFGWDEAVLDKVQAVHLKLGQGAKTGTGGHLPGHKVTGRIAEVRRLPEGTSATSPSRFPDWTTLLDAADLVAHLRERSSGIPIGIKMSAQHVEADLDAALEMGVDYVILDGRGGGTGAAPTILRDSIGVPTMAALARARRHLDSARAAHITLIATGGLRRPQDMAKALALGADALALSNVPLQAIGCVGMRACHTDTCPMGIATQQPHLRARLPVQRAGAQLTRYFESATQLLKVLARACGHDRLGGFTAHDLTSWKHDVAQLAGVAYAGATR
jgi:glutamate synthase domain-containing protein 2